MLHFTYMCGFPIVHETVKLQLFQLTPLVIRGFPTCGNRFIMNPDRVVIKDEVRGVLLCVQVFIRIPHFTQRSFWLESGLTTLSESVTIADSIMSSSVYPPWSSIGKACAGQLLSDLRAC